MDRRVGSGSVRLVASGRVLHNPAESLRSARIGHETVVHAIANLSRPRPVAAPPAVAGPRGGLDRLLALGVTADQVEALRSVFHRDISRIADEVIRLPAEDPSVHWRRCEDEWLRRQPRDRVTEITAMLQPLFIQAVHTGHLSRDLLPAARGARRGRIIAPSDALGLGPVGPRPAAHQAADERDAPDDDDEEEEEGRDRGRADAAADQGGLIHGAVVAPWDARPLVVPDPPAADGPPPAPNNNNDDDNDEDDHAEEDDDDNNAAAEPGRRQEGQRGRGPVGRLVAAVCSCQSIGALLLGVALGMLGGVLLLLFLPRAAQRQTQACYVIGVLLGITLSVALRADAAASSPLGPGSSFVDRLWGDSSPPPAGLLDPTDPHMVVPVGPWNVPWPSVATPRHLRHGSG